MNCNETLLWQRFMESKGVLKSFEYLYRVNRFDKRDISQFLSEVNAEDVIMSAFCFKAGNSIFGYKYWKDMNEKWMRKLGEYQTTGEMPMVSMKCPHCKRELPTSEFLVTKRGLFHKHCKECESGEFDRKRKEVEKAKRECKRQESEPKLPEKEASEEEMWSRKTTKVCSYCGSRKQNAEFDKSETSDDGLQSICKTCQEGLAQASEVAEKATIKRTYWPKLGEYDATLHYQSKKSITFNSVLSDVILKGGFTKCYLNSDRSLRQFLIFNKVEGANIVNVHGRSQSALVGINSADICRKLAARFKVELGDTVYLHISRNLSHTTSVATIEVIATRSREEYTALAQRREDKELEQKGVAMSKAIESVIEEERPVQAPMPASADEPLTADEKIAQLVECKLITEQDIAAFLYKRGWKLQEPIRSYKKFTL